MINYPLSEGYVIARNFAGLGNEGRSTTSSAEAHAVRRRSISKTARMDSNLRVLHMPLCIGHKRKRSQSTALQSRIREVLVFFRPALSFVGYDVGTGFGCEATEKLLGQGSRALVKFAWPAPLRHYSVPKQRAFK